MKKTLSFILILALLASVSSAFAAPENRAGAAILIHADSGQVLYSDNSESQMLIASTTKIMTALVVLDNCEIDESFEIPAECTGIEGSSMYLKAGERRSVRELLYGMMLISGNDAASALAWYCAGGNDEFAALMNEKVRELGLSNTSFENPHGLDGENQYSTAHDLALITKAAMENEFFAEIVSTKTYTAGEQSLLNHNKLLWNYEGCLGVKTGYTMAAGRTLVSCAERDGVRLICVTLSDPDDWKDHTALYDWAFSQFEYRNVLPLGEICRVPVISGDEASVSLVAGSERQIFCEKDAELSFVLEVPRFVYAAINEGETAGKVRVLAEGTELGEFPLVYANSVPVAESLKLTPWQRFLKSLFVFNKYGLILSDR